MRDGLKAKKWLPKVWPALASGVLLNLAFPPFHLSLLVFAALVPLLLYLRDVPNGKRAFRAGLAFGFTYWLGSFSFIAIFVGKWTGSLLLGIVPYLLGCAIVSVYFGLFGWLAHLCYRNSLSWLIPFVWAGVEVLRSFLFGLAFPYGFLASPLVVIPEIVQTAHYGTVYLTSAWVALANLILAELMTGSGYLKIRWHVAAFLILLIGSAVRFVSEQPGSYKTVVVGQTGVDMAFGDATLALSSNAAAVNEISEEARGADLLVLPEGIVRAGNQLPPPILFRVDPSLPVVFGGQRGSNPSYQSAFSYDGEWDVADKTRLVVFGEYVPFRNYLPFLDSFRLPGGDLVPGDKVESLDVGAFRVGGALCFEALFADVAYAHALNGSNLLAVMSIDDWYFGTNAPEQLRDGSAWRAIETGMPVARAASLGYSAIYDARGSLVAVAPLEKRFALRARVKVPARADLFVLLPVFPGLALLSLIAIPVWDAVARRRARARGRASG